MMRLRELAFGVCVAVGFAAPALAQCERVSLTNEVLQSWSNPKPSPNDVLVPLPGGTQLALVDVTLSGPGLYLDGKSAFKMGSQKSYPFETPLDVRIGSPLANRQGIARLVVGKYELSKGQYAMIMGTGTLAKGIAELARRSRDERTATLFKDYLAEGNACQGIMTQQIATYLSEPLSFLGYGDYAALINELNLYCVAAANCRSFLTGLGPNPDFPGFFRLPTEHEWEYLARGGRDLVAGTLGQAEFQADRPYLPPGSAIATVAHIDSTPQALQPIGSKEPWFGFHDMIGSVQELMQNPFTAENGFGAVGGYVARGGSFRTPDADIRVSSRTELSVFLINEQTDRIEVNYFPNTGIRLMLGLPIVGRLERTGAALADLTQDYTPLSEAGDIAGNTATEARDLGALLSKPLPLADEVGSADPFDYFSFELRDYAALALDMDSAVPIAVMIEDGSGTPVLNASVGGSSGTRSITTPAPMMPGRYLMRFAAPAGAAPEISYAAVFSRVVAVDTGLATADAAGLASPALVYPQPQTLSGYVGSGDRTDFYPLRNKSQIGGLMVRLANTTARVKLSFLDERQNVLASGTAEPGKSLSLPMALKPEGAVFLLVAAEDGGSTRYDVSVNAALPFDAMFGTDRTRISRFAVAKQPYAGLLSASNPVLFLGVDLKTPRELRVELGGLDNDVDLDVLDSTGTPLSKTHNRTGTSAEFFSKAVEAGRYFIKVSLRDRSLASGFAVQFDTFDPQAGSGTVSIATARAMAEQLGNPASSPSFETGTLRGEVKYYRFRLDAKVRLVADLSDFAAGADLDLYLETASGMIVQKSGNAFDVAEKVSTQLVPGEYYLRIQPNGTVGSTYVLTVNAINAPKDPDFSDNGAFVERNGDWAVYRKGDECSMVSIGAITPSAGWLRELPSFQVAVSKGSNQASLVMLYGSQNIVDGTVSAVVRMKTGQTSRIPAIWRGNWLMPAVVKGAKIQFESAHTRLLRAGTTVEISGRTPDGDDARVTYSLAGYTKSANTINRLCRANARWILGE